MKSVFITFKKNNKEMEYECDEIQIYPSGILVSGDDGYLFVPLTAINEIRFGSELPFKI